MQWYNLTEVNAKNILTLTQSINELFMENDLGNIILVVIFAISYLSFTLFNDDPKMNLTVSLFAISIFSILFRLVDIVPDITPFFCWGLFALSISFWFLTR